MVPLEGSSVRRAAAFKRESPRAKVASLTWGGVCSLALQQVGLPLDG